MARPYCPTPPAPSHPLEDRDYNLETVDIEITSDFTYTKNMQLVANSRMIVKSPAVPTIAGNIDFNPIGSTFLIEPGAQVVIAPTGSLYFESPTTSAKNEGTLINHGRIYGYGTTFVNNGTMVNYGMINGLSNSEIWQIHNQGQFHNYGTVDDGCSFKGGSVTPNEISSVTATFSSGNTTSVVVAGQLPQGAVYVKLFDERGGDTLSPSREAVLQSGDGLTATGSIELPPPSSGPVTYTVKAGFDGTYWAPVTESITAPAQLPAPVIATQGGGTEIPLGGTLTLEVANAAQYNAPAYQWYREGSQFTGETGDTLAAAETGAYKVAVTDEGRSRESDEIILTRQGNPPPSGNTPSVSTNSLTVKEGESGHFAVSLGLGTDGADSATITSSKNGIADATPTQMNQSGEVEVAGFSVGSATISIGYSGGIRDGDSDTVQVTVAGNDDNSGGNNGGNTSGGSRSSSSSSGSRPDGQTAKTQLPASAFSWDGDCTLTINHERITPLGLLSVWWNDGALTRGQEFGVYSGSVIIRFSEDFIAAQSPCNHTSRVGFLNHTGETTITVGGTAAISEADDNDTHNPNTGGGRGIWPAPLLGSLRGIALVVRRLGHVA